MFARLRVLSLVIIGAGILISTVTLILSPVGRVQAAVLCSGGDVAGVVYRDYNSDGLHQAHEEGVAGVTVDVYTVASNDTPVVSCQTDAGGAYSLAVSGDFPLRLEFRNWPDYLASGVHGSDSGSSNMIISGPTADASLALSNPAQSCQAEPNLATSCYVMGNLRFSTAPAFIDFPYASGSLTTSNVYTDYKNPTSHDLMVEAQEIGTTYGLAYAKRTQTFYLGAFMRRHSSFGPGGPGAIYAIDYPTGTVSLFADLSAGPDPHTTTFNLLDWMRDAPATFDAVGKVSLGDIDISPDEATLWVVNLFDKSLYAIDIASATPTGVYSLAADDVPAGCTLAEMRPFGLGISADTGRVYSGWVCANESGSQSLTGYVYSLDPNTPTFELELSFPFTYTRGCNTDTFNRDCAINGPEPGHDLPSAWNNWSPTWNPITATILLVTAAQPQPWIQDIAFDGSDNMILGIGDRFGYQSGFRTFSLDPQDLRRYVGTSGGDLLRACQFGGAWTLENNGMCGDYTTRGATHFDGPGNGEYYFQESFLITGTVGEGSYHNENSLGGLAYVPGQPEVAVTSFASANAGATLFNGPGGFSDGGVRWYNTLTGVANRGYVIYDTDETGVGFGKAAGLGDLEAACQPPTLEIGNYVWYDLDKDGLQDPDEPPVVGATISLYDAADNLVGAQLTNADGHYYFAVTAYQAYTLALDNAADYDEGGPLFSHVLTAPDASDDIRDSDGQYLDETQLTPHSGFPGHHLTADDWGRHNHTYDFGFVVGSFSAISLAGVKTASAGQGLTWAATGAGLLLITGLAWRRQRRSSR